VCSSDLRHPVQNPQIRLMEAGARGLYRPDLRILHWVPAERLQKKFLRNRQFWSGVSLGWLDRVKPMEGVRALGIPRYLFREPARAPGRYLRACLAGDPAERFYQELFWWRLAGIVAGRFILDPPQETKA
jgi:glucosyl-dolichyl phosphate glucuronosyltransferase